MSRENYQEKIVIHRQYRITNENQEALPVWVRFENPFKGFPDLPDSAGDPEEDTIPFFPAKAIVPEAGPPVGFNPFLCKYDENTELPDVTQYVDWQNDDYFVFYASEITSEVVVNLTLWWPVKNADKRYYSGVAVVPPPV